MEENGHERRHDTVDRADQNRHFSSELGRADLGMSGERQEGEGVVRGERHPDRDLLLSSAADPGDGIDGRTAGIPADSKAIRGDPYHIGRDQRQSSPVVKYLSARRAVQISAGTAIQQYVQYTFRLL